MGVASWLGFETSGILMRRWGGSISGTESECGVVLGDRGGLCNPGVGSWGVDEAPSIRVCRFCEGGRGKLLGSRLMLRIVRIPRAMGDAVRRKGAWSLWK